MVPNGGGEFVGGLDLGMATHGGDGDECVACAFGEARRSTGAGALPWPRSEHHCLGWLRWSLARPQVFMAANTRAP